MAGQGTGRHEASAAVTVHDACERRRSTNPQACGNGCRVGSRLLHLLARHSCQPSRASCQACPLRTWYAFCSSCGWRHVSSSHSTCTKQSIGGRSVSRESLAVSAPMHRVHAGCDAAWQTCHVSDEGRRLTRNLPSGLHPPACYSPPPLTVQMAHILANRSQPSRVIHLHSLAFIPSSVPPPPHRAKGPHIGAEPPGAARQPLRRQPARVLNHHCAEALGVGSTGQVEVGHLSMCRVGWGGAGSWVGWDGHIGGMRSRRPLASDGWSKCAKARISSRERVEAHPRASQSRPPHLAVWQSTHYAARTLTCHDAQTSRLALFRSRW